MVKITREHAATNRAALLDASGRLFRQKGVDGVGVNELCKAAGLTVGALYSHFGSKNEIAAAAFRHGERASNRRLTEAVSLTPSGAAIVDFYVSSRHRDNLADCCPMLASASDAARQDAAFKEAYRQAFLHMSDLLKASIGPRTVEDDHIELVVSAAMIGVVATARALKESAPDVSDTLMTAARKIFSRLVEPEC